MVNGIRTSNPCELNKGCGSKFYAGSWVWRTPEEGYRTYWPKHCEYNNKDEDNSPKTLNDKNQASSQKFKQLELLVLYSNSWKHLTVCKQMSFGSFKDNVTNKLFTDKLCICILQFGSKCPIFHKTQSNQIWF